MSQLWYDDFQLVSQLDDRFAYMRVPGNRSDRPGDHNSAQTPDYIGPRDYFDFTDVFSSLKSDREKFASKNVEQYLYEELRAMEITASIGSMDQWHYSNELKHLHELDDANRSKQCENEIKYLRNRLLRRSRELGNFSALFEPGFENVQLARWIDTWGRPPSETYLGNSYWTGSYRGCRQIRLPWGAGPNAPEGSDMRFRFCWLKLRARGWPRLDRDEMRPRTSFKVGICVPESCTSKSVKQQVEVVSELMQFNFAPVHRERFASSKPFDVYCLPDDEQYTDTFVNQSPAFYIVLVCIALWLFLIVVASLIQLYHGDTLAAGKPMAKLLYCLSIQSNFKAFVEDNEPNNEPDDVNWVDLRPLGVFKFLACLCVVSGHGFMSMHWVFYSSTINVTELNKPRWCWWNFGFKMNDVFMLISGMITSYGLFLKFSDSGAARRSSNQANKKPGRAIATVEQVVAPTFYLKIFLFRYLRLAPMYVLVLVFLKCIYPLLSDGPFWDYGTYKYSLQGKCQQESWVRTLLPVIILFDWSKRNPYYHECLPLSWYLISDLKLALIAPLFVYLVQKSRNKLRTSILLTLAGALVSILWQYKDLTMQRLIYLNQSLTYGFMYTLTMLVSTFSDPSHYGAMSRLSGFIAGLFTGHILYLYKIGVYKKSDWPPKWLHAVWVVLGAFLYFHDVAQSYYVKYHYHSTLHKVHSGLLDANSAEVQANLPHLDELWLKIIAIVRQRLDTIIVAMWMLRASTDWSTFIMTFTKPIFKLSKLAYCVYLIHTILISYSLSSHEKTRLDSQPFYLYLMGWGYIGMSFALAFPLHILIESPFKLLLDLRVKQAVQQSSASKQKLS